MFPGSRNLAVIMKNYICIARPSKSRSNTLYDWSSIWSGCKQNRLYQCVDFKMFEVIDIKNVRKNEVILTVDLETRSHTHPSRKLLI